ncbi:niban-like protein 1 [Astyanax mexicanus]|uniref:Niban apoptosis regulator 2 n=1 Tax=Astyanax mexicanus TaxID=7994 RepID=A0A8B9K7I0_ASTMX|nr:niban-like protein 1 [Astyanax mexicanus]
MGDLVSSHLDEGKREIITVRTGEVIGEFGRLYEQQYAVALFNKVRFDVEGGGGPQPQLLHRKVPLENKSIFSGSLFQYLEENKKWRNRFLFVPDSYNISYYESKQAHDRGLQPKGTINCAGYRVLTSMEKYLELLETSLPGVKAKVGSSPFLKCATQFPLILWHPYARHHYFCVGTEKEQQKWNAVFQDCVRHSNNGLSEESKVQTPAFTDAVRLYRQARGQYGTWDMMCGVPSQILANLVMEKLLPELRDLITPRLKGKLQERQKNWILISDAVYGLVQSQAQTQYEAIVQSCEAGRPPLEASIRTDMDQIITSKEHVTSKIRALVLPKAEKLLKVSIQPYISSILEALMEPTSRGFFEVRDVFFRELVDMSKNLLNGGSKEKLGEHMEKISMLAFHPVKMQGCYERVEQLSLEGLQQRFDVTSPSVFLQRAQILMREQMDDAVYTFEQLLHQSLEGQEEEDLCKTIQKCQDRVIKKFDYDSSTVRKKFFREALLQVFIPYMLKQLSPSCSAELPRFQELIFEDFSRFILVENIFEEVVLQTVMKDIMMAVKEAAVQRRHNLYRDSIVLTSSDPNLHLLEENPPIDWAGEYGGEKNQEEVVDGDAGSHEGDAAAQKRRRMKQVVSMIQEDGTGTVLPNESCIEVPGVEDIPEEEGDLDSDNKSSSASEMEVSSEASVPQEAPTPALPNGTTIKEEKTTTPIVQEQAPKSPQDLETKFAIESAIQEIENAVQEEEEKEQNGGMDEAGASSEPESAQTVALISEGVEPDAADASEQKEEPAEAKQEDQHQTEPLNPEENHLPAEKVEEAAIEPATETEPATDPEPSTEPEPAAEQMQEEEQQSQEVVTVAVAVATACSELQQTTAADTSSLHHNDSGFQSPANEVAEEEEPQVVIATMTTETTATTATEPEGESGKDQHNDSETGEEDAGKGADTPAASQT